MTDVLITCDTELSPALHQRGLSCRQNAENSVYGVVPSGAYGVGWQIDVLEAQGLKGIFFVDPMPALLCGDGFLRELAELLLPRGHEIQLHIHTEWLAWSSVTPVAGRQGRNIGDFALDDQIALLECAIRLLTGVGIPRPIAFRAGNYGANDDTLRALSNIGVKWDSSYNPAYAGAGCAIGLPRETRDAVRREGIIELPVASLFERPGRLRPAQVCALSAGEMRSALRHAASVGQNTFVIVNHSFEMLSRDRARPNRMVMRRFEALCQEIARNPRLRTVGFNELDPTMAERSHGRPERLSANFLRTGRRMIEQALGTVLYERRIWPE